MTDFPAPPPSPKRKRLTAPTRYTYTDGNGQEWQLTISEAVRRRRAGERLEMIDNDQNQN